jgi:hypothetical protein
MTVRVEPPRVPANARRAQGTDITSSSTKIDHRQQPIWLTVAVNLKIAKSLGLTVPQSILLRADEVRDFAAQHNWTADGRNGSCVTSNAGPHGGA